MTPDEDHLVRESLPAQSYPRRSPRSAGRIALLAGLAALLVLTIAGTTALVVRDLRLSQPGGTSGTAAVATWTPSGQSSGAPTAVPSDPRDNGWTPVSGGSFSDVQFTQSSGQRGYLCGTDATNKTRLLGVTTDGGNSWQIGSSPAGYDSCSLQVSATDPLDVVLFSSVGPCGSCTGYDAHYSTDGGKTWKVPPLLGNTQPSAIWAGSYLYIWVDPTSNNPQQGFLEVSADGSTFTAIDPNALVPGASGEFIQQVVAGGSSVYITLAYNGCSSTQGCTAVVASADGGKTWTRVSNTFNFHVVWVAGSTLYGEVMGQSQYVMQVSTDNGATWKVLAPPPLPDGSAVDAAIPGGVLPAADGTLFALEPRSGNVAYLRAGVWTLLPFSSRIVDGPLGSVTFGPDGHPQRVWVFADSSTGGGGAASLYWHAV